MTMRCLGCKLRWMEFGKWPARCPYCSTSRIIPVTPLGEELTR